MRRFGPYELEARLGRGSTAEVWRASRGGPGGFRRTVVLKRLLPEIEGDRAQLELLLGEARLAARLNHPNVVAVHEVVEDGGAWALVLDWVDGCDLRALLRRQTRLGPPPPGLGAWVVAEVCRGLAHAHGLVDEAGRPLRIIHRDVSPSNIMLSRDGAVRLVDFGVGKALAERGDGTGSLKGNLAYMAPEQLARAAVDERADVYAAGVVLWETLTARRLFKGAPELAAMAAARAQPIAPPSAHNPAVPPALDAVCRRAMAFDRDARFASAAELAAALEPLGRALGFGAAALAPLVRACRAEADAAAEARAADDDARRTLTAVPDRGGAPDGRAAPAAAGRTPRRRGAWIGALVILAALGALAAGWWWSTTPSALPPPPATRARATVERAAPLPLFAPLPPPTPPSPRAREAEGGRRKAEGDRTHAPAKARPSASRPPTPDLTRGKLLDPFSR